MHENHQLQGHHCSTISGPYMYAHPSQHSNQLKTKLSDYCFIHQSTTHCNNKNKKYRFGRKIHLNWNMPNIEWSKFMFTPKPKKVQSKPKGDTNIMELLWSSFTKMHQQMGKICSGFYIFLKQ